MNDHIMLRCPHCDRQYEAKIETNELVKDGLMITPVPVEIPVESETELTRKYQEIIDAEMACEKCGHAGNIEDGYCEQFAEPSGRCGCYCVVRQTNESHDRWGIGKWRAERESHDCGEDTCVCLEAEQ